MADVRLTATNPEDSSVVPVACNAKGELLLEKISQVITDDLTVEGELTVKNHADSPQGTRFYADKDRPADVCLGIIDPDGPEFVSYFVNGGSLWSKGSITAQNALNTYSSINVFVDADTPSAHNLSNTGSAQFANGKISIGQDGQAYFTQKVNLQTVEVGVPNGDGTLVVGSKIEVGTPSFSAATNGVLILDDENTNSGGICVFNQSESQSYRQSLAVYGKGVNQLKYQVSNQGDVYQVGSLIIDRGTAGESISIRRNGTTNIQLYDDGTIKIKPNGINQEILLQPNGNASFCGGKCGFWGGALYVTDSRGNKVITDFISNGMMTWSDYPTAKEKAENWVDEKKEERERDA